MLRKKLFEVPGNFSEYFVHELFCFSRVFGFGIDGETKTVDITNAHISVDNNGTKESGTTENLTPGAIVTITLNKKGEATYILVTSTGRRFGGRGGSQG